MSLPGESATAFTGEELRGWGWGRPASLRPRLPPGVALGGWVGGGLV